MQNDIDIMTDKVMDYLQKSKIDYRSRVDENEKILAELGYSIKRDTPPEFCKYFDDLAGNIQVKSLDEGNITDRVESVLSRLDLLKLEKTLEKEIGFVDKIIQDLEKEEIHLEREVEKCVIQAEVVKEKANESEVKAMQLRAKNNKYNIELQSMEPSQDIISKYKEIKSLLKKRECLKLEISKAESKVGKYCGLPPNIEQAKDFLKAKKKEYDESKKDMVKFTRTSH